MKKRIFSFLLCILMLATSILSLAGCGGKTQAIFTKDKAKAMTITITTIYDDYDPANESQVKALKQVQDALNEITETKYNTHVIIQPMKSADYMEQVIAMSKKVSAEIKAEDETLDAILDARKKDSDKNNNKLETSDILKEVAKRKYTSKYQVIGDGYLTAANDDLVYKDEFGRYQTMYPSVDKEGNFVEDGVQLDIVLINSAEMYNTMVEFDYLYYLDSEFLASNSTSNTLIQKYVNQVAYDYVDIDMSGVEANELYAIPNNAVFGEYGYIVVNKALFDEYGYDINFDYNSIGAGNTGAVDDFSDLENFVNDIIKDTTKSDYRPVLNNPQLEFLSFYGDQSVMVTEATSKYNTDIGAVPKLITNSTVFRSYFRTMYALVKGAEGRRPVTTEWLTDDDLLETYKDEKFGLAFAKGNLDMIEKLAGTEENPGDYYVVVTHTPYIDNNIYESMYAISSCVTADPLNSQLRVQRCYQILELFATNSEWVNTLTYGVRGEQYEFSHLDDGLVVNRSDDYTFDRRYAGNMFLQYLSEDMDPELREYAENNWDLAKRQNRNANVSPYAGLTIMTERGGDEPGPLTIQKPGGTEDQQLTVASILEAWGRIDAKYYEMISSYDHYESYIAENPDASFDDYFKMVTGLVQAESQYSLITSAASNSPQAQYNAFFLLKRDSQ